MSEVKCACKSDDSCECWAARYGIQCKHLVLAAARCNEAQNARRQAVLTETAEQRQARRQHLAAMAAEDF